MPSLTSKFANQAMASVESLKLMIENREFIPSHQFRLVSGEGELEGGSLEANGVSEDEQLEMMLQVPAGMRKKWRKKRMRRLRRFVNPSMCLKRVM